MIEYLPDWLVEVLRQEPHLPKTLAAGILVSIACSVIGCFIVLRRMSFLADAVAHSLLAGVVCGYLVMRVAFGMGASAPAMLLGAVLAGLFTVALIGFVTRFSRIKEDTAIGIMYTGIFAAGGVLLSRFSQYVHLDLAHFLTGQVLAVQDTDLWMMALVAAGVLAVVILFYRELQLISFDRVMAASIGIPVLVMDYVLTACTSLVVVSGVNIVGVIMVVGLLITPAATAYLLSDRLTRMLTVAAGFGVSSFLLGYVLSELLDVAPGSAIVVMSTAQFLVVLAVSPRYGLIADWLRRRSMIPQPMIEDVLGAVYRSENSQLPVAEVLVHVAGGKDLIRRAIRSLEKKDYVKSQKEMVMLTNSGKREAKRLLRAHRLWESYLAHVGEPADQLHEQAHVLEHVHDEEAIDYLDDKLGHPLVDPHGSEIPEDFVHLAPGAEVKASLLRKGRQGVVSALDSPGAEAQLRKGDRIEAGPRLKEGSIWTFRLADGREVQLDHETADAVIVKVE